MRLACSSDKPIKRHETKSIRQQPRPLIGRHRRNQHVSSGVLNRRRRGQGEELQRKPTERATPSDDVSFYCAACMAGSRTNKGNGLTRHQVTTAKKSTNQNTPLTKNKAKNNTGATNGANAHAMTTKYQLI